MYGYLSEIKGSRWLKAENPKDQLGLPVPLIAVPMG